MYKYQKAVQVLNFFAIKAKNDNKVLHKTNALKLLYFADKKHLRDSAGRTITGDIYKAQRMGPVASFTFDIIETIAQNREGREEGNDIQYAKQFLDIQYDQSIPKVKKASQSIAIKSKQDIDTYYLSRSDIDILEQIWELFGDSINDRETLWRLTHKYPEGSKYEDMGMSQQEITKQELISTTTQGRDPLGDITEKELKNVREVYIEREEGLRSLGLS